MKDLGVVFDSELSFAFPVRHFPVLQIQLSPVRFLLQLPVHGTLCRLSSEMNSHWRPFDSN